MPVNPWGGTYAGLKSLDDTFGDLTQQARQARNDALQEPILRNQAAMGSLQVSEAERKAASKQAYDSARQALPATGNPHERIKAELDLAMQHNQWERVSNLATVTPLMDKLDPNKADMFTKWSTAVVAFEKTNKNPEDVKKFGNSLAAFIDPTGELGSNVDGFNFNSGLLQKDIFDPDGKFIGKVVTGDNGVPVVMKPNEPKQMTDAGMRYAAAGGDPQARAAINEADQRKESADIRKDSLLQDRESRRISEKERIEKEATDKLVIKQTIKDLPKLKEKAKTSESGIQRIDKMLGLLESGAGGRLGQAKAWLAPTLEAVGVKSKDLSNAQLYQILARTLGGSMRMEIIGPGQVSDYENRLMAAVSGGGGTSTEAAKELLTYYRGIAENNINDYNNSANSVGDSPSAKKSYRPIGQNTPSPVPTGKKFKIISVE